MGRCIYEQDYLGASGTVTRNFDQVKKKFNLINHGANPVTVNIIPEPVLIKTTVDADSNSAQKVLNVASTTSFVVGDTVTINRGGARYEFGKVASIVDGVSLTMVDNLASTHTAVQADVVEKTNCFYCPTTHRLEGIDPGNFKSVIITATAAYTFNVGTL